MADFDDEQVRVGGDVDRIAVSLRIAADDLTPSAITMQLGVEPTFAYRKGEVHQADGRSITQRTGLWVREFSGAPEEWTLDDAITELLRPLPADREVWMRLAADFRTDVFCALYIHSGNRGLALSVSTMRELTTRSLNLDFDIYYVGED